jgi:phosphotransferase system enzyme I (PtsI)
MSEPITVMSEVVLKGIAAAPGIAVGPTYFYSKETPKIEMKEIVLEEAGMEIQRVRNANARSEKELQKILSFAEQKLGSQGAKIFEAQIMILNDGVLMGAVEKRIAPELKNASLLWPTRSANTNGECFESADEYMHERAHDVRGRHEQDRQEHS